MRLEVKTDGSTRVVALAVQTPDATVRDLALALGFDGDVALAIDGTILGHAVALGDVPLVDGSVVTPAHMAEQPSPEFDTTVLGVVGGPDTGSMCHVDLRESTTVGRGVANDLPIDNTSVSTSHAVVRRTNEGAIEIEDLNSRNGTWIDGSSIAGPTELPVDARVRLGSSSVVVRRMHSDDRPVATTPGHADASGHILVNRPPRPPVLEPPAAIVLPGAMEQRTNPTLTIVSLLVPVVFAAVMVVALGSWRYAIFGLLSPVMAIGNWLTGRRRVRAERKRDHRTHRDALLAVERDLRSASEAERQRRRSFGPDLLEIRRRVEVPSIQLWERRFDAADAMNVRLGMGESPWDLRTDPADLASVPHDVRATLEAERSLQDIEVLVDLTNGPVGFIGDASRAEAAARSALLQLATHHGPADIEIAVLTTPERIESWAWTQWLPHCATTGGGARVLAGEAAAGFASRLLDRAGTDKRRTAPGCLLVVDDVQLLHGRSSPARRCLEMVDQRVFGIVVASTTDQLPSSIHLVAQFDATDGAFSMREPGRPETESTGISDSVPREVALDLARAMARFEDPDCHLSAGSLADEVRHGELFEHGLGSPEILARWRTNKTLGVLRAEIGLGESGVTCIDLVADGPHGLIAGTTGAGKSEFLRTMIVGLASNHDPDDVVFVLIDYKGGSAFDRCAALPHVVGIVTDLDAHLAERALQSLEAELTNRERVLRTAEATDIDDYRRIGSPAGAIPRVVVAVDEFATLRNELPEFVTSLVGIAQRGRSLGVHLILATQRPSGAVDANIRANTNLRVAFRVQHAGDSSDVIDVASAVDIPRSNPGRAFVRRGSGDLDVVQTAYISGPADPTAARVRVADVQLGQGLDPVFERLPGTGEDTELDRLVATIVDAAGDRFTPRRPWLEPLPAVVTMGDLEQLESDDDGDVVAVALGDDPSNQRRMIRSWNPATGHLGIAGVPGSGVTTTIRSLLCALALHDPQPWVFASDHAAGGLSGIDEFPHVSCCLQPGESELHDRLLSFLETELQARRDVTMVEVASLPLIVIAVDGVAAFWDSVGAEPGTSSGELLARVARDGPALRMVMLLGVTRWAELPRAVRPHVRQHITLEQSDPTDYASLGVRGRSIPTFCPGRALVGPDAMVSQIVNWERFIAVSSLRATSSPPIIDALTTSIDRGQLGAARVGPGLQLPIGITDTTRADALLTIRPGDHAVVAGPPGSGRTTALTVMASKLRAAAPELVLVAITPEDGGRLLDDPSFDAGGTPDDVEHVVRMAAEDDRRWVVIVDDADRIDLEGGPLFDLARNAPTHVTIIASLRTSVGRQAFGHWTRFVRTAGTGVVLQPENASDGEVLGVRLPRHVLSAKIPGRGYLVGAGTAVLVQLAQ